MAENLLTYILLGVIGVLGWMVVDEKYINPSEIRVETDTVFVDKPFPVETIREPDAVIPETITMWETEYKSLEKIELVDDTVEVYVDSTENDPLFYHTSFLTNYSTSPKFLELNLDSDEVTFTGLSPSGNTMSKTWSLDYAQNRYRMAPNGKGFVNLEAKRKHRFLGLKFDFNHSLGVGTRWNLRNQEIIQDFYLKYNPSLQFKQNIALEGNVWVTPNPFGTIGIDYQF